MGCLFSKTVSATSKHNNRASNSTRVHRLGNSNSTSNGIIRVPKINVKPKRENSAKNDIQLEMRIQPPPPAPPPSPPTFIDSPKSDVVEAEKSERFPGVHDAEDLEPVTPLTTGRAGSPFDKESNNNTNNSNKVSVSNVSVKTSTTALHRTSRILGDLSVEELDTEMDDFSRISGKRYKFRKDESINPSTTDILLPRRKDTATQDEAKGEKNNATNDNSKAGRDDTPLPKEGAKVPKLNLNRRPTIVPELKLEEAVDDNDKTDEAVADYEKTDEKSDRSKMLTSSLRLSNTREEKIMTLDASIAKENTARNEEAKSEGVIETKNVVKHSDKSGTLSDIIVETVELPSESKLIATPKNMYDKELEKERIKRKRKRGKRSDTSKRTERGVDRDEDVFLEGSLKKTLKTRPGSGASTWTLDSKKSFGSTDTLRSFDMETETDKRDDRYSYINSQAKPISFKGYKVNENTEIIDLEDNGGDPNNDSWLTDDMNESRKDEKFDVWYGMKPYEVVSSAGKRDSGVVREAASGHSSGALSTKQKLIYSRFARRPQSESILGDTRRPPKPPNNLLKARPVSDTIRKPNPTNTFYTTDLDIH